MSTPEMCAAVDKGPGDVGTILPSLLGLGPQIFSWVLYHEPGLQTQSDPSGKQVGHSGTMLMQGVWSKFPLEPRGPSPSKLMWLFEECTSQRSYISRPGCWPGLLSAPGSCANVLAPRPSHSVAAVSPRSYKVVRECGS